jgi:hypothetical protein
MAKYVKKPIEIEAIQFTGENHQEIIDFTGGKATLSKKPYNNFKIHTLEGKITAIPSDYIIKGVNGEFYPCKEVIFKKTYKEVVEETFVDRLIKEKNELEERVTKLGAFLDSTNFQKLDKRQRELLQVQHTHMLVYLDVLVKRISLL